MSVSIKEKKSSAASGLRHHSPRDGVMLKRWECIWTRTQHHIPHSGREMAFKMIHCICSKNDMGKYRRTVKEKTINRCPFTYNFTW